MMRNFILIAFISLIAVSCAMFGAMGGGSRALENRVIKAPQDRVFAALADEDNLIGMRKVTDTGTTAVYETAMDEEEEGDNHSAQGNLLTIRLTRPKRVEIILSGDNSFQKRTISVDLNPLNNGKYTAIEFNGNIGEAKAGGGSNAEFTSEGKNSSMIGSTGQRKKSKNDNRALQP